MSEPKNAGPSLAVPKVAPLLDPRFRPAALVHRAFRAAARATGAAVPVTLALEQPDGPVFHFDTEVFPAEHPGAAGNLHHVERLAKFLLWSRGGSRIFFRGPAELGAGLARHYQETVSGQFDADMMGARIFERPFEVVTVGRDELPAPRSSTAPLGRHLEGCRIGFDLGGSDRKVAAVLDGEAVFSEETVWDPYFQPDPQYHFDGIMDSLRRAAAHLPRVDAIGGSAAGVYVGNRPKVASLFRGVPPELFCSRVKDLFFELRAAWGGVPFEVVNDGKVTALAGSMALGVNGLLGTALGTSQAGGFVDADGHIPAWLNELAFVPVDCDPAAPVDEWSGDCGVGAKYFSQQAVGRLLEPAGIDVEPGLGLPEKLKRVQALMAAGDARAEKIYQTLGVYLGYGVAHYADFYEFDHLLILGRVTSGPGGDVMLTEAQRVLAVEFPDLAARIRFHMPDEKMKRHGQAIAAASLPALGK